MALMAGMQVRQVEPGTEIEGPNGKKLTVTERNAVTLGRTIYVTPKQYQALKEYKPEPHP